MQTARHAHEAIWADVHGVRTYSLRRTSHKAVTDVAKGKRKSHSQRRLVDELPEILEAKHLSIRALALKAGVSPSHLTRVLRKRDYKTPSAELCQRIARALDLPADYWPEYRERLIVDRLRSDPELREELYARLTSNRRA